MKLKEKNQNHTNFSGITIRSLITHELFQVSCYNLYTIYISFRQNFILVLFLINIDSVELKFFAYTQCQPQTFISLIERPHAVRL